MPYKGYKQKDGQEDDDQDLDDLAEDLSREVDPSQASEGTQQTLKEYRNETAEIVASLEEKQERKEKIEHTLDDHGGESPFRSAWADAPDPTDSESSQSQAIPETETDPTAGNGDWSPKARISTAKQERIQEVTKSGDEITPAMEGGSDDELVASATVGEGIEDLIETGSDALGGDQALFELAGQDRSVQASAYHGVDGSGQAMVASKQRMQDEGAHFQGRTAAQSSYFEGDDFAAQSPAAGEPTTGVEEGGLAGDAGQGRAKAVLRDDGQAGEGDGFSPRTSFDAQSGDPTSSTHGVELRRRETPAGESELVIAGENTMTRISEESLPAASVEAAVGRKEEFEDLQNQAAISAINGEARNESVRDDIETEQHILRGGIRDSFEDAAEFAGDDESLLESKDARRPNEAEVTTLNIGSKSNLGDFRQDLGFETTVEIANRFGVDPGENITNIDGLGGSQASRLQRQEGITEVRDLADYSADEIQELGNRMPSEVAERAAETGDRAAEADRVIREELIEATLDQARSENFDSTPDLTRGSQQSYVDVGSLRDTSTPTSLDNIEPLHPSKNISVGHETVEGRVIATHDTSEWRGDQWQVVDIEDDSGEITRVTIWEDSVQYPDDLTEPDVNTRVGEGRHTDMDGEGIHPERDRLVHGDRVMLKNVQVQQQTTGEVLSQNDPLVDRQEQCQNHTVSSVPETEVAIKEGSKLRDGVTDDNAEIVQAQIDLGLRDPVEPADGLGDVPTPPSYENPESLEWNSPDNGRSAYGRAGIRAHESDNPEMRGEDVERDTGREPTYVRPQSEIERTSSGDDSDAQDAIDDLA